MTLNQFGLAVLFSIIAAAIITPLSKWYESFIRKVAIFNLEQYNLLLARARTDLEQMISLQKKNQLVTKLSSGNSDDYVRFCIDSLENCCSAAKTVNSYLERNEYHFTIKAFIHLRKFSENIKERISDMEDVIKLSSRN